MNLGTAPHAKLSRIPPAMALAGFPSPAGRAPSRLRLLNARAVAVPSGMEGMLLQSADSATSFASMALDVTQLGQLGSLAYDKLLGSTSGNQSLSVIPFGTPTAPYGGGASTGMKPGK